MTSGKAAAVGSASAPRERREFGGVPGNLALIVGLPAVTAYLYFCVRWNGGALLPGPDADAAGFFASLRPSWPAAGVTAVWLAFQAALQQWAPGPRVFGTPLADGTRLAYRMNGRASLVATAIFVVAAAGLGFELRWLHDHFGELLTSVTLFCFGFAGFLYVYGRRSGPPHAPSGSFVHDYFMGTALNPRIPPRTGFDLKLFCEARPGLLGWMVLNAAFASVQLERYGFVSTAMLTVCALQLVYIVDYFWNEPAILTTMDVKYESFGFMLAFGDLAWVPFTYCIQAFYLIDHVHDLPLFAALAIAALDLAGMAIFRVVNLQKHRFRMDPEGARIWGKPPESIETAAGGRLLVSGFWGWSRHFNYVGDWLMALAWSLPCLFGSIVPYFYPIYFGILLVHRERRDNRHCQRKYGADWERYCRRVRWRIVPGLY